MTNLERYKDEFIKMIKSEDIDFYCYFNGLHDLGCDSCPCCDKYSPKCNVSKFYDWLLEEHKEPIKLTQFEHDILKAFTKLPNYVEGDRIDNYSVLQHLSSVGWFKDIDEHLTIKEILDNCEVVDD